MDDQQHFYPLDLNTLAKGDLFRSFSSEIQHMKLAFDEADRDNKGSISIKVNFERDPQDENGVLVEYKISTKLPDFVGFSRATIANNGQMTLPLTVEEFATCRMTASGREAVRLAKELIADGTEVTIKRG